MVLHHVTNYDKGHLLSAERFGTQFALVGDAVVAAKFVLAMGEVVQSALAAFFPFLLPVTRV